MIRERERVDVFVQSIVGPRIVSSGLYPMSSRARHTRCPSKFVEPREILNLEM
jgi:hypothetical protein